MSKKSKTKVVLFFFVILCVIALFNVFIYYFNIQKTVNVSVANQGIEVASGIAINIDRDSLESFLASKKRVREFSEIQRYLLDSRQKSGAMYVYLFEVSEEGDAETLIVGWPRGTEVSFPIGFETNLEQEYVNKAKDGESFYTRIIEHPPYGAYITSAAPIIGKDGSVLAYIGVDNSIALTDQISSDVMKNSLMTMVYQGLIVFILFGIYLMMDRWYQNYTRHEVEDVEETFLAEVQSVLSTVRSLRHDFLNHVQVIHGLLRLDRQEAAMDYIMSISEEVRNVGRLPYSLQNPVLLALLQIKVIQAKNQQIMFDTNIEDHLYEGVKSSDLMKILSNLLDNAMEATVVLQEEERYIQLQMKEEFGVVKIKVKNSGPSIEKSHLSHVFQSGFSTKRETKDKSVRGQGLFIVSSVVNQYNGTVDISREGGLTVFSVTLKKRIG
ncbi:hypothetical protein Q73_00840 [Bacillus coahuilensis m2-6]|uniref:sensor histidine kinase n=1 Tax=Bacillus coahuilensis TaxID=408580 RepID=UPI000750198D|nr:ATP-binding protein [Bacillus coahuilensis]KUP09819.1 hypothetical protein Q73_00840 [Bacillus coahuilensis m2-6]